MQVENGFQIWHLSGTLIYAQAVDSMYTIVWRPQTFDADSVGPSPLTNIPPIHPSAAPYQASIKVPSTTGGAYRPPGMRSLPPAEQANGVGSGGRGRYVPGADPAGSVLPPGAALATEEDDVPLTKAALKNKKKREARKEAAAAAAASEGTPNGTGNGVNPADSREGRAATGRRARSRSRGPAKHRLSSVPPSLPTEDATTAAAIAASVVSPNDKKIRGLLKKLRAIEELKLRQASGDKLEDTQIKKMTTEDGVRSELEALGYQE